MKLLTTIFRKQMVVVVALATLLGLAAVPSATVFAGDTKQDICTGVGYADGSTGCAESGITVQGAVRTAIRLLSYVAGIASVIMIIVAGLRYITSNGDPSGIKSAKDAIIYAIVGLIVVVISQAIVKFVLTNTTNTTNTSNRSGSLRLHLS